MLKVIDNFLTKSYHKELKQLMDSADFPWYYNSHISYDSGKAPGHPNRFYETGFSHIFWDYRTGGLRDSSFAWLWKAGLSQIQDAVNQETILRSRGDMTMYVHEPFVHDPHIDFNFPNISTILYINDSSGDTVFYKEKVDKHEDIAEIKDFHEIDRVTPKANRLVMFDGNYVHAGSSPHNDKNRILINSNFCKEMPR
jgi:hypothetical protein